MRRLQYQFQNLELLRQALTHRSYSQLNNERLEFLGDAILSFVIANLLYQKFPDKTEGEFSRLRAALVKGDTLSEIGLELNLGDYLLLGQGELKSGGFRRSSILSDAFEALIAAIYLDGGLEQSQALIERLFENHFNDESFKKALVDSKTQLQEILQAKKLSLPLYELIKVEGMDEDQVFYVSCTVKDYLKKTEGIGRTRRKAEQEAAKLFLLQIRGNR